LFSLASDLIFVTVFEPTDVKKWLKLFATDLSSLLKHFFPVDFFGIQVRITFHMLPVSLVFFLISCST
jgi:hypothetical protein